MTKASKMHNEILIAAIFQNWENKFRISLHTTVRGMRGPWQGKKAEIGSHHKFILKRYNFTSSLVQLTLGLI